MIIGERPVEEDIKAGRHFRGDVGKIVRRHFSHWDLDVSEFRQEYLCPDFQYGTYVASQADIERHTPRLYEEIERVRPATIITIGTTVARVLLGAGVHIEAIHGMPYAWTSPFGVPSTVMPLYSPAAAMVKQDLLGHVWWDHQRAAKLIKGHLQWSPVKDLHPSPRYYDISEGVIDWYFSQIDEAVGIDTEGVPRSDGSGCWSVQVTATPGTGMVIRNDHPDYRKFIKTLKYYIRKKRPTLVVHNALYDLEMTFPVGLDFLFGKDLLDMPLFDTQMAAYLLGVEPQSLKMLAYRHCGMAMKEYAETVGEAGKDKQIDYLEKILTIKWPKPEARVEHENDGTNRVYTPQPVERRAQVILNDVYGEKIDKDGELVDPLKRWRKVDPALRLMVERKLGAFPIGTLADIPLQEAVNYAGRDPDAAFRLYPIMKEMLRVNKLTELMDLKMGMLRAAVAMKMTGILGRRTSFVNLVEDMQDNMDRLGDQISKRFFRGRPFNPASADQTRVLMSMHQLTGEKKTKGDKDGKNKKVSTSKKSIEHLRFQHDSIELLQQWREHQKCKDSFGESALKNWPDGDPPDYTPPELVRIKTDLKITRVSSGRFSAAILDDQASAPLLAIPVRTKLGKVVRDCYEAEDGYVIGSWDLDQAEMRLMAHESRDSHMMELFNEGKIDIHGDTAARCFKIPYEVAMASENKMIYRYPAKRCGFGVITGIQDNGLLDQLRMAGCKGWDVQKVGRLRADWFKVFTGVADYMEQCHRECRKNNGIIRDRWGMPRYLPNIFAESQYDKWEAQRQTHSHRIQAGAQGWLQHAMAWMWKEARPFGDAVRFILQIHDSIMLEVADGLQEEVDTLMVAAMTGEGPGIHLDVPMRCKGAYAKSWGQMKD